ncbi:MAG: DUF63 family protein [Candidatus Diapherotrites archaeon]|nr:DUF63 family protein [Candidatus Diapherotrites archaeon]
MNLEGIWQEFFVRPATDPSVQGYNLVNTLVYGGILLAFCFFVLFPFLDKKKISFNFHFFLALLPFILFGTLLRALNELGIFSQTLNPLEIGFYTFTPGVWIGTALITVCGLLLARRFSFGGLSFEQKFGLIGFLVVLPVLLFSLLNWTEVWHFVIAAILVAAVVVAVYVIVRHFRPAFFSDRLNLMAIIGQALDGTASFYAITYCAYSEQHPLSEAILSTSGPAFIFIKIGLVLPILYYVDKDISSPNMRGFVKVMVSILGFATGLASLLKLGIIGC